MGAKGMFFPKILVVLAFLCPTVAFAETMREPDWGGLMSEKNLPDDLIDRLLHEADPQLRLDAAMAFMRGSFQGPDVVEALVHALEDPSEQVRIISAIALGTLGDEAAEAVPSLAGGLEDPSPSVQNAAAVALGEIGEAAKEAVPSLARFVEQADYDNELAARAAIVKITGEPGPHVSVIVEALTGRKTRPELAGMPESARARMLQSDRLAAIMLVGSIGPAAREAVPELLAALHQRDSEVSMAAADALGLVGAMPERVVPALTFYVESTPEMEARARGIRALGSFPKGREQIVPLLLAVLEEEEVGDQNLSRIVLDSLRKLRAQGPEVERALEGVLRRTEPRLTAAVFDVLANVEESPVQFLERAREELETKDSQVVRESVIGYLSRLAALDATCEEAVAGLLVATLDSQPEVRLSAAQALGNEYGCLQQDTVKALTQMLWDSDEQVVRAAIVSLGNLGGVAESAIPHLERLKAKPGGEQTVRRPFCTLQARNPFIDAALVQIRGDR